jgi:class 3 adenylate cyclase
MARKRPLTRDSEREDNATHRADTLQREKRRKENVTLLRSDGKEVNVEETALTEAD